MLLLAGGGLRCAGSVAPVWAGSTASTVSRSVLCCILPSVTAAQPPSLAPAGERPARDLTEPELHALVRDFAAAPERWRTWSSTTPTTAVYELLVRDDHVAVWLICWMEDHDTGFHDHDVSAGAVAVVAGRVREERLVLGGGTGDRACGARATRSRSRPRTSTACATPATSRRSPSTPTRRRCGAWAPTRSRPPASCAATPSRTPKSCARSPERCSAGPAVAARPAAGSIAEFVGQEPTKSTLGETTHPARADSAAAPRPQRAASSGAAGAAGLGSSRWRSCVTSSPGTRCWKRPRRRAARHAGGAEPPPGPRVAIPRELHPEVATALREKGIDRLWSHQADALHAAWAGPTIVTTGTASGKSLCFQLPTLDVLHIDVLMIGKPSCLVSTRPMVCVSPQLFEANRHREQEQRIPGSQQYFNVDAAHRDS